MFRDQPGSFFQEAFLDRPYTLDLIFPWAPKPDPVCHSLGPKHVTAEGLSFFPDQRSLPKYPSSIQTVGPVFHILEGFAVWSFKGGWD